MLKKLNMIVSALIVTFGIFTVSLGETSVTLKVTVDQLLDEIDVEGIMGTTLTRCGFSPGFRGIRISAPGKYETMVGGWFPVPGAALGCAGVISRGMGNNWDLGAENTVTVGEAFFVSLACRIRKQLSDRSFSYTKIGYHGLVLGHFEEDPCCERNHGMFCEASRVWSRKLKKGCLYWGGGAGFMCSLYPSLGQSPGE